MVIDPAAGLLEYQARDLAFRLGLKGKQVGRWLCAARLLPRLPRPRRDEWWEKSNPLAITGAGDLVALDA